MGLCLPLPGAPEVADGSLNVLDEMIMGLHTDQTASRNESIETVLPHPV
jgi:hypothetical protein